jgi:hypothetical protein
VYLYGNFLCAIVDEYFFLKYLKKCFYIRYIFMQVHTLEHAAEDEKAWILRAFMMSRTGRSILFTIDT